MKDNQGKEIKKQEIKNQETKRRKSLKEKGITLVALVVTIVILLILTGVTLNLALSDNGLFDKSKEAVEKYEEAEDEEENAIGKLANKLEKITIDYNDYVGCYVEGYKPDTKEITITSDTSGVKSNKDTSGNIIANNITEGGNQTFKTETDMKWRIWDYDKNTKTIRLISAEPTDAMLTLEGATGYNNGVWVINEICRRCYGQYDANDEMKKGINVANLRRSDIQKISTYDYTDYKHEETIWSEFTGESEEGKNLLQFGESKKYNVKTKYPKMWSEHDSKWAYIYDKTGGKKGQNCDGVDPFEKEFGYMEETEEEEDMDGVTFKQSYYRHEYKKEDFKDDRYFEIIFKENEENVRREAFWLSTRCTQLWSSSEVLFLVSSMGVGTNQAVGGKEVFSSSSSNDRSPFEMLRPIVSINLIKSGYRLEKINESDGSVEFELVDNSVERVT